MEVRIVGRVTDCTDGRPGRSRDRQSGEVLYYRVSATLAGRLYVGASALYAPEGSTPELYQDVDFMEVSDLEAVAFAPSDWKPGDDVPLFDALNGVRTGDHVIVDGHISHQLPRTVQAGQTPRKVFQFRVDAISIQEQAPQMRRPSTAAKAK